MKFWFGWEDALVAHLAKARENLTFGSVHLSVALSLSCKLSHQAPVFPPKKPLSLTESF